MESKIAQRPIMGREELARHHVGEHGRDFSRSDDGYGDMEVAEARKWKALSCWGADGWDLGDWPYLVLYIRTRSPEIGSPDAGDSGPKFQVLQVCEGDHDIYEFDNASDRDAALDYLFLWYAVGKHWAPISYEQREALDTGQIVIDDRFRGPYRRG